MTDQNKTTQAQRKASRNWEKKNPEKARSDSYRRTARLFIRKHATIEDLEDLKELIKEREEGL